MAEPLGQDGLPLIVDLHHVEPERLQVLFCISRVLCDFLLIRSAGMVPRAVERRLRCQLDGILPCHGVGVGLKAQPGIVEVTDDHGVDGTRFPRFDPELAEIDLGSYEGTAVGFPGKEHADAALMGQPAADNPTSCFRVNDGRKRVTAGCPCTPKPTRAQRTHVFEGNVKVVFELQQLELGYGNRLFGSVRRDGVDMYERVPVVEANQRHPAVSVSDGQLVPLPPDRICNRANLN